MSLGTLHSLALLLSPQEGCTLLGEVDRESNYAGVVDAPPKHTTVINSSDELTCLCFATQHLWPSMNALNFVGYRYDALNADSTSQGRSACILQARTCETGGRADIEKKAEHSSQEGGVASEIQVVHHDVDEISRDALSRKRLRIIIGVSLKEHAYDRKT